MTAEDKPDLLSLLGDERKIGLRVQKEFEQIEEPFHILLSVERDHSALNLQLLKYLQDRLGSGIYVTVNHPIVSFLPKFELVGISPDDLYFIDGITKRSNGLIEKKNSIRYIESPEDLVELNYGLEKFLKKIETEKNFVVIDSITTLLVYNDTTVIEKFVHTLVGRLRATKTSSVFITSRTSDKDVLNFFTQFFDKIIDL